MDDFLSVDPSALDDLIDFSVTDEAFEELRLNLFFVLPSDDEEDDVDFLLSSEAFNEPLEMEVADLVRAFMFAVAAPFFWSKVPA